MLALDTHIWDCVLPRHKNSEHTCNSFRGKCSVIVPSFFTVTAYRSEEFLPTFWALFRTPMPLQPSPPILFYIRGSRKCNFFQKTSTAVTLSVRSFRLLCWKISMLKYFRRMSTLRKFFNTKIYLTKILYNENFPIYGTRFGIKVWVLAEAKSGYVLDFQVYTGGSSGEKTDKKPSLGQKVVLQLM